MSSRERPDWIGFVLAVAIAGAAGTFLHGTGLDSRMSYGMSAMVTLSLLAVGRLIARWNRVRSGTEGPSTGEVAAQRLAELEQRVTELEAAQTRMAELEERVDFAERLLVQQTPAQVQPGRPAR